MTCDFYHSSWLHRSTASCYSELTNSIVQDEPLALQFPGRTYNCTSLSYLQYVVLPNVFFHTTTAYDILRHEGVPLGKANFLGKKQS